MIDIKCKIEYYESIDISKCLLYQILYMKLYILTLKIRKLLMKELFYQF
jgi:hypothetical protein